MLTADIIMQEAFWQLFNYENELTESEFINATLTSSPVQHREFGVIPNYTPMPEEPKHWWRKPGEAYDWGEHGETDERGRLVYQFLKDAVSEARAEQTGLAAVEAALKLAA